MKNHYFFDVLSLNREILIRTVSNLFKVKSTEMSSSVNIDCIAILLQELLLFVDEILPLFAIFTL